METETETTETESEEEDELKSNRLDHFVYENVFYFNRWTSPWGGGIIGISSDGGDWMEAKKKRHQKLPRASNKTSQNSLDQKLTKKNPMPNFWPIKLSTLATLGIKC